MVALRNNNYINAVIKETFRLYPTIISALPRIVTEGVFHIGEFKLPAGTVVGMQSYVHHRDPSVFPQPESFRPERWLESTKEMTISLMPFSVGGRNCIGQNLAWEEISLAVDSVMRAGLGLKVTVSNIQMSNLNLGSGLQVAQVKDD